LCRAGNVAQTIFDAGTLLHKKRAADAAFDQAAETYRSTVIAAFQNVADTLHALQFDADALAPYPRHSFAVDFTPSYRDLENLLAERGLKVSSAAGFSKRNSQRNHPVASPRNE
jgi:hypothetical protein